MSHNTIIRPLATCGVLLLAACAPAADPAGPPVADAAPYYVRHSMQAEVNPAIVSIWDITNNAMDDTGALDPALIDEAGWTQLYDGAGKLAAEGEKMATAENIRSAREGNMAVDEFEVPMSQVQALIDADPEGFRAQGREFAALAIALEEAAESRDAATAGDLVAQMDAVCSSCHAEYWYAEPS